MSNFTPAPYKSVSKHIQRAADGAGLLLTCQSKGYPGTAVVWRDAQLHNLNSNTSSVSMPDQRVQVTSQLLVSSSDQNNNYTCNFTADGVSATFHLPGNDEMLCPDSFRRHVSSTFKQSLCLCRKSMEAMKRQHSCTVSLCSGRCRKPPVCLSLARLPPVSASALRQPSSRVMNLAADSSQT